ncbi:DUF3231 family protein [Aquibacillus koreensis]|uniref:DUF3231 family protein n=1 Tax=Aquibacillus koreensis TaxID=279446 RepID=A0A9X4AJI5_9BACI|nr:DUF3231 family protein [Aquibacillus koreensis]MCT2535452.1 DUF3231 family protein [Aquibacillus koreensis]MDC3422287.1 DUF3231 family protein [Aquibacillus koreensis]
MDKAQLTSVEIANLWTQYLNDTMSICVITHLLEHCEDKETIKILETALDLSNSHVKKIELFLKKENYPIPEGFSKNDLDLKAPRLFSDNLILAYMQVMALHGMNSYSLCTTTSIRTDQRSYFSTCLSNTSKLYDSIIGLMLDKGILSKPPNINTPDKVEYVDNQQYLAGWFGKKRPLNAIEVSGLHYNIIKTVVKVVLEIAFSQVTEISELRGYYQRGAKLCRKQIKDMEEMLSNNNLPAPMNWESEITESTTPPFSEKLMLFHVVTLVSVAIGYYGAAFSVAQRRDLAMKYTKLIGEIGLYVEDGANLMIKHGWLEKPPMFSDRQALAEKK